MTEEEKKINRRQMRQLKKDGVECLKEWNTTRKLYSQVCLLAVVINLLQRRIEHRMLHLHGQMFHQKQKMLFGRALKLIQDAGKVLDELEIISSGMGWHGDDDFVKMNTILNSEAYAVIRLLLNWQNCVSMKDSEFVDKLEDDLNAISKGHNRQFSKKLIDTFKLEEEKK